MDRVRKKNEKTIEKTKIKRLTNDSTIGLGKLHRQQLGLGLSGLLRHARGVAAPCEHLRGEREETWSLAMAQPLGQR